jgi:hypothetical protein
VTEHHKRAFALFAQKELDPVGGNGAGGWHRFSALFSGLVERGVTLHTKVVCASLQSVR